jgi:hypothetical protein
MPTEMLIGPQRQEVKEPRHGARSPDELRPAERHYAAKVRRLKVGAVVLALWTILITPVWLVSEWRANGALQRFGHEGDPGQWNPTLWAIGVGVGTLVVGIMALGVYFGRPTADRSALRVQRLKFHVAAWLFGMVVLTPLWALVEWQDNGGFERWSANSRPGDWDPWILAVGGIWALAVIALFTVRLVRERPADAR